MSKIIQTVTSDEDGEFTAESFLKYLSPQNKIWWSERGLRSDWVFRGHRDKDWDLVPSIARELHSETNMGNAISNIRKEIKLKYKQEFKLIDDEYQNGIILVIALNRVLHEFQELANEMNVVTGQSHFLIKCDIANYFHSLTQRIVRESVDLGDPWLWNTYHNPISYFEDSRFLPKENSPFLSLAQHHGIPTFNLDWSTSQIVAAYFASISTKEQKDICVWAFNTTMISELNEVSNLTNPPSGNGKLGTIGIAKTPNSNNQYLSSQRGLFSTIKNRTWIQKGGSSHPSLDLWIREITTKQTIPPVQVPKISQEEWDHLNLEKNKIIDQLEGKQILKKIILKKDKVSELRSILARATSRAHVMPSFDNMAKEAMRRLAVKL